MDQTIPKHNICLRKKIYFRPNLLSAQFVQFIYAPLAKLNRSFSPIPIRKMCIQFEKC